MGIENVRKHNNLKLFLDILLIILRDENPICRVDKVKTHFLYFL